MSQTRTSQGRRAFLWLHRWIGLILGLVLVVIGLTGSLLVFGREIDAALNPALFRASPGEATVNFAAAQRIAEEASGRPAGMIRPPDTVWPVWVVYDRRGRGEPGGFWVTHIDPVTGQVLGRRDGSASFVSTMRQLHEALLLRGWNGREIVGWIGVFLFFMSLSGIYIWWPRDRGWWPSLTLVRRRPFVRLNLDLHGVTGIWISVVMTVVSFSGVAIIFPGWFRPVLGIAEPAPPQRPAGPPRREAPTVDADAAVAAALAAAGPGQVVTTITAPAPPAQRWMVTLRPEGSDPELRIRTMMAVDPWSGVVVEERSPRTRGIAEEALAMQRWLHGGPLLGMPGRLLVFLSGLALPVLFATGLLAWLGRRRSQRRLAAQRAAALSGVGVAE
jgi:uncharacterized iron-regulated membrane protein